MTWCIYGERICSSSLTFQKQMSCDTFLPGKVLCIDMQVNSKGTSFFTTMVWFIITSLHSFLSNTLKCESQIDWFWMLSNFVWHSLIWYLPIGDTKARSEFVYDEQLQKLYTAWETERLIMRQWSCKEILFISFLG